MTNKPLAFVMIVVVTVSALPQLVSAHLHPGLGRFLQRDFDEYSDSLSLYEYVRSSPIVLVDDSGKCAPEDCSDCDKVCHNNQGIFKGKSWAGATFCCQDGTICPCVNEGGKLRNALTNGNFPLRDWFDECTKKHEQTHKDDPKLKCDPNRTPPIGYYDNRGDSINGECAADAAESACFKAHLADCKNDVNCIKAVNLLISEAEGDCKARGGKLPPVNGGPK